MKTVVKLFEEGDHFQNSQEISSGQILNIMIRKKVELLLNCINDNDVLENGLNISNKQNYTIHLRVHFK